MGAKDRPVVSSLLYGSDGTAVAVRADGAVPTFYKGVDSALYHGIREGYVTSTSTATAIVRASLWADPGDGGQRSIKSSSNGDASAGSGVRTVRVTYYRSDGSGPFIEDKTLTGTTALAFTETDLRFVERIEALTVGGNGASVGNIDICTNNNGTGTVLGRINAGENSTYWAHHWIPPGKVMNLTSIFVASRSTGILGAGSNGRVVARKQALLTANAAVTDVIFGVRVTRDGSTTLLLQQDVPVRVEGPCMFFLWKRADGTESTEWFVGFSFYDA